MNEYPSVRQAIFAKNVVATSQPLAAQAGVRALIAGGNAVDAAISTAIALTVVEPTSNGIGSDAFAIVWNGRDLHGLNASGRSPAAWTAERFQSLDEMPTRGWDAVTVPGAVSAWVSLSERFGRLEFNRLFDSAIDYAKNGYLVSPIIGASWARGAEALKDEPGFAATFMPNGEAPRVGEIFKSPEMAHTLEMIAASRGEQFYRGELARKMIAFSESYGGAMTLEDLSSHTADWTGTVSLRWQGHEVHEIPPNGQGIAALIALGILERISGFSSLEPDSVESIHLQIEAMKLAFADLHRHVGDIDHMHLAPDRLLDSEYLRCRAGLIDRRHSGNPTFGTPAKGGTVYLTAADETGMMVSYIQSNYMGFGSGVVVPGTGISLQNRGCGFTPRPGRPNSVGPSKRPFHTIIPGFVTKDGQPTMSFGVMGGHMQAQGHVQMANRILIHRQNPQQAIDAPRWQVNEGNRIAVEATMPDAIVQALRDRGHQVDVLAGWANQGFGGAQVIQKVPGGYSAGSDQRKDGQAVGY